MLTNDTWEYIEHHLLYEYIGYEYYATENYIWMLSRHEYQLCIVGCNMFAMTLPSFKKSYTEYLTCPATKTYNATWKKIL